MRTHEQAVHEQFDSQAQAYLTSAVHSAGPDLQRAEQLVGEAVGRGACGLDVGCGAGHLSFRLAPLLARMTAVDPSPRMLQTVARMAREKALAQLDTCQASAESLPFGSASVDLVGTRYSAHHWTRLERALDEIARVLRPSGYLLLIDTLGPEEALADTHLQSIELLRDRSHVRNRSLREWVRLLRGAGFELLDQSVWPTRIEFDAWIERMRTPSVFVSAIRALQAQAPVQVQQALGLEPDGSFLLQTGLLWARRAAAAQEASQT